MRSRESFGQRLVRFIGLLGIAASLACAARPAHASAFSYGIKLRTFNCAVLMLPSAGQEANAPADRPSPYPFYVLSQRQDCLPVGWVLQNPLGPKQVTTDIASRYPEYTTIQAPITSSMAAYWEVDIDSLSDTTIRSYDLLVIHTHDTIDLTYAERSLLRYYLDSGGTLLVDDAATGAAGASIGAGFIADVQFWNNCGGASAGYPTIPIRGQSAAGDAATTIRSQRHPILTYPFFMTPLDISQLGQFAEQPGVPYFVTAGHGQANTSWTNGAYGPPDPSALTDAIVDTGNTDASGDPVAYIAAGDYGSGHLIVSAADILDGICTPVGATGANGGYCGSSFYAAPTQDLQLLANILAWSKDLAETDGGGDRHTNAQESELGGSLLPMWQYQPDKVGLGSTGTPYPDSGLAPAIYGNIAYVVDNSGILHAFDLNPTEDLDGSGNPDNGVAGASDPYTGFPFLNDLSRGTTYDELWTENMTTGVSSVTYSPSVPETSAPAILSIPQPGNAPPITAVVVERADGSLYGYYASVSGGPSTASGPTAIQYNGDGGGQFAFSGTSSAAFNATRSNPIPSPIVFHGRIFAVQPDARVEVIDPTGFSSPYAMSLGFNSGGTVAGLSVPATAGTPSACQITSTDGIYDGDDLVVYVPTSEGIASFLVGSRDEKTQYFLANGTTGAYQWRTKATAWPSSSAAPYLPYYIDCPPEDRSFNAAFTDYVDVDNGSSYLQYLTYAITPQGAGPTGAVGITAASTGQGGFSVTPTPSSPSSTPIYIDYDVGLGYPPPSSGTANYGMQRIALSPGLMGAITGAGFQGEVSVGAENESVIAGSDAAYGFLEAVSDQDPALGGNGPVLSWRFVLAGNVVDGDGISYNFGGYRFVGSPISPGNGRVYALAANGSQAVLMCFNVSAVVTASIPNADPNQNLQVLQTEEGQQLQIPAYQYHTNVYTNNGVNIGSITFTNFSYGPPRQMLLEPDLSFPLPIQVAEAVNGQTTTAGVAANTYLLSSTTQGVPLLDWWYPLPSVSGANWTAPRMIGNWIYFGDGTTSNIYSVYAYPHSLGLASQPGTREIVVSAGNASLLTSFYQKTASAVGPISSPMAGSGEYAVATGVGNSGGSGVEGFGFLTTMIADNNRLIEVDPNGDATWTCDSTAESNLEGGTNAVSTTTRLGLNRPSTIAEVSTNDYLVADTGNNRCVRFNRNGQVIWELSSFNDPNHLLSAGETTYLTQPTSAIVWTSQDASNDTIYHYLIADSGNYRIVEVDDVFPAPVTSGAQSTTAIYYHQLVWTSRTYATGRRYRYVAAQLYTAFDGNTYIMGAISNKSIAPVVYTASSGAGGSTVTLPPPTQDGSGSTLVALYYGVPNDYVSLGDITPVPGTVVGESPIAGGDIVYRYSSGGSATPFPIITQKTYVPFGSGTSVTTLLRSVRFLVDHTLFDATPSVTYSMVADDDGVFDGLPVPNPLLSSVTAGVPTSVTFSLGDGPTSGTSGTPNAWSFTLADYQNDIENWQSPSLQIPYANTNFVAASALKLPNGDYLITNRASKGDAPPPSLPQMSGVSPDYSTFGGNVFEINPNGPTGNFLAGSVFGLPSNTGAITQPAFAMRPN